MPKRNIFKNFFKKMPDGEKQQIYHRVLKDPLLVKKVMDLLTIQVQIFS